MPPSKQQPLRDQQSSLPPVAVDVSPQKSPLTAPSGLPISKKPFYARWWSIAIFVVVLIVLIGAGVGVNWYTRALEPVVSDGEADAIPVTIMPGATPDQIADQLESDGLIKSSLAFSIHTRLEGVRGSLQAGSYSLHPTDSTPEIVVQLTDPHIEESTITFYPGSSLYINAYDSDQTPSHREVLEQFGYSRSEIEGAFEATYDHPLLVDKPMSASVEGYIFGETYQVKSGAPIKDILTRTFDEMYSQMQQNGLIEAYEGRGMTLHDAVTLASIIEREVHLAEDQRQVAQVFYKRMADGMPLGADATFVYAARMDGVQPTVNYDSPYNTRVHSGLPPGPIASPSITALKAVADPAGGDYLYFVSGDDGKNYFSRTLEEHEQNTERYCKANCSLF